MVALALLGCPAGEVAELEGEEPACARPGGRGFAFSGAPETFVVPECVTRLTVELWGAQGGPSRCGTDEGSALPDLQMDGGRGGWLRAEVPVRPGEVVLVRVGGRGGLDGAPGWNGGGRGGRWAGGGGGGSDFRIGGASLIDRALVAGGGGGGSCGFPDHGAGGAGGGLVGEDGTVGEAPWIAGGGGRQLAGGEAGSAPGQAGVFGLGGGAARYHVAGGGGGWYGGGGAYGAGGGGGSSHASGEASAVESEAGARGGDGAAQIYW
ncbi:glycine-rich protein [Nannocystis bainbridge]|uniref:receptor protein-tyrosine kinase n=1 Tax=Nannocystis bainbridge TaxID=2995303 RepID=A0ABT5E009_9BACT|nr:glycine-rich protein [Nannocystis bainbridge]MDC0719216.1 glycine-rich protein [Nannocystis bainbridge]